MNNLLASAAMPETPATSSRSGRSASWSSWCSACATSGAVMTRPPRLRRRSGSARPAAPRASPCTWPAQCAGRASTGCHRWLPHVRRGSSLPGDAAATPSVGVNLAAGACDGGEVVVPARGEPRARAAGAADGRGWTGRAGTGLSLDLNSATGRRSWSSSTASAPRRRRSIVAYREEHGGFALDRRAGRRSAASARRASPRSAQLGQ